MTNLLSLDWLSLYVRCPQLGKHTSFTIKRMPYGTRQYRYIDEYFYNSNRIATLCHAPLSPILTSGTGILKFDNHIFYTSGGLQFINYILNEFDYELLSISRLDICSDFQYFDNGWTPNLLIHSFLKNDLWKIGQNNYNDRGKQDNNHKHSYLRFGSNTSDVAIYLYNKSLEMREVKQKNYIVDKWKKCNYLEDKDIWRLEVSIKGSNLKVIDTESGEQRNIQLSDLQDFDNLTQLYNSLIDKYFEFRINDGQQRKDRMERLPLFSGSYDKYCIYIPNKHNVTTRADRIFVKKAEETFKELRERGKLSDEVTADMLLKVLELTNLDDWYLKQLSDGQVVREVEKRKLQEWLNLGSGGTPPV